MYKPGISVAWHAEGGVAAAQMDPGRAEDISGGLSQ